MMTPEEYQKARADAEFHVQLEVKKVVPPARSPGICAVEGVVVRVFRGSLAAGTPMRLELSCRRKDERVRPGGEHWTSWEALEKAKFLEAYVNREGAGYAVAAWQSEIIPSASAAPQFPGKD